MNNRTVLLLIAIGVLIAVLFVVPANENFGQEVPYTPQPQHLLNITQEEAQQHITDKPDVHPESSVDCKLFPKAPACEERPPPPPVNTTLTTCVPSDGEWSIPSPTGGRSKLNSPCCQPPKYGVATNYKTCDDQLDPSNPIEACISQCCGAADTEAVNYDASWYPMARCACSLWCYNKDVPHFKKWGTPVHYITGDLAEAQTSDSGDFIGGTGFDFSGQ